MGHSPKETMKRIKSSPDGSTAESPFPCWPREPRPSAPINQISDHRKKEEPHTRQHYNKQGKLEPNNIFIIQSNIFSSSNIHTTTKHVMTFESIHYDLTRLIQIRITWSDSADACTFGGYLCSPPSCSPPSYVLQVFQWIKFPSPQG